MKRNSHFPSEGGKGGEGGAGGLRVLRQLLHHQGGKTVASGRGFYSGGGGAGLKSIAGESGIGPVLTGAKAVVVVARGCCAGRFDGGASSLGLTFHPQGVMHKIRRTVHKADTGRDSGWAHQPTVHGELVGLHWR